MTREELRKMAEELANNLECIEAEGRTRSEMNAVGVKMLEAFGIRVHDSALENADKIVWKYRYDAGLTCDTIVDIGDKILDLKLGEEK